MHFSVEIKQENKIQAKSAEDELKGGAELNIGRI